MLTRVLFVVFLSGCLSLVDPLPTAPNVEDTPAGAAPGKNDSRCPSKNGAVPIFVPHETNCAKYYVCDTGLAIPLACPHHLLFNKDLNICDHPENVVCPSAPSSYKRDAVLSAPAATGIRQDSRCPRWNLPHPTYLPHETDCSKFYVCNSGLAIPKICPASLSFNVDINVCDWPANVDCRAGLRTYQEETSGNDAAVAGESFCPKINGRFPVFLPHDTDCGRYYVCDWGRRHLMHCPPSMGFDPEYNVCSVQRPC